MKSEKSERIVDLAASLATKADEIDQVLVIYHNKETDKYATLDNELTVSECLWLTEAFRFWMLAAGTGLLSEED